MLRTPPQGLIIPLNNLGADIISTPELSPSDVNVFNKDDILTGGYYKGTTGVWTVLETYASSNFIEVKSGEKYVSSLSAHICFFDSTKTFVSGMLKTELDYTTGFQVPAGVSYLTMSCAVADLATKMLVRGTVIPSQYVPYYNLLYFTDIIKVRDRHTVDVVIFMGQSNMAGRGDSTLATTCPKGYGYEFRSISDPTKLYDVVEPFGVAENVTDAIDDTTNEKTGGMVSSLMREYYLRTGIPIVGISASEGGTAISVWAPASARLIDAKNRFTLAVDWLESNGYTIRHKYMVWDQGENDSSTDAATYKATLQAIIEDMMGLGLEKCFVVRTGDLGNNEATYNNIIAAQTDFCKTYANAMMASVLAASFDSAGLMKVDNYHYTQAGYNLLGRDVGKNIAFFVNNGIEPSMWDVENTALYYPQK